MLEGPKRKIGGDLFNSAGQPILRRTGNVFGSCSARAKKSSRSPNPSWTSPTRFVPSCLTSLAAAVRREQGAYRLSFPKVSEMHTQLTDDTARPVQLRKAQKFGLGDLVFSLKSETRR